MPGSASNPIPLFQLRAGPQFRAREPHVLSLVPATGQLFTEFYCQSGGSNLNGGSDTGNSAKFTSTNGNWSTTTNIFTPTDGTNPVTSGVKPGDFASIYVDGASEAVYIALITAVSNAANGPITVSGANVAGTAPSTSATGRTIKVGGAWKGPNAGSGFPFTLSGYGINKNGASNQVRTNLKNDATYSLTSSFAFNSIGAVHIAQGYSSNPGDGGKATLDGATSTGTIISSIGIAGNKVIDLIFSTSIGTGSADLVTDVAAGRYIRCVFTGSRGTGLNASGSNIAIIECEAYNCNTSNTSALGGFRLGGANIMCLRCVSHDNGGSNNSGFVIANSPAYLFNCISETNGQYGANVTTTNASGFILVANSDFYNNSSDAIRFASGAVSMFSWLENNNFIKNAAAINNLSGAGLSGFSYNNASANNRTSDVLGNIQPASNIIYSDGTTTPWNDPDNGDFRIVLGAAMGAGRGAFTASQGYTAPNTIGYPDIGAAQAQPTTQTWVVTGTQTLPYGYINHLYGWKWYFSQPAVITLVSGSLPPGLILSALSPTSISIRGIPTTAGVYDFTLRATSGSSTGDAPFEISILDDPDEGIGGLLGGLRPTC